MFERFTSRAREAIVLAQEESRAYGHNYTGTEHILLGLIHGRDDIAAQALNNLGFNAGSVRSRIEAIIGRGDPALPPQAAFTERARKVVELSLREALQLGYNYIDTEHVLLGLIREGEGVAAQILAAETPLTKVRSEVLTVLASAQTGRRSNSSTS